MAIPKRKWLRLSYDKMLSGMFHHRECNVILDTIGSVMFHLDKKIHFHHPVWVRKSLSREQFIKWLTLLPRMNAIPGTVWLTVIVYAYLWLFCRLKIIAMAETAHKILNLQKQNKKKNKNKTKQTNKKKNKDGKQIILRVESLGVKVRFR